MPDRPDNSLPRRERDSGDETRRDWEPFQTNTDDDRTERLRVAGGWLIRTLVAGVGVAMVYVESLGGPDEE